MGGQSKCDILRRSRDSVVCTSKAVVNVFTGVRIHLVIIVHKVWTGSNSTSLRQDESGVAPELEVIHNDFSDRSENAGR